jgi:hypothetical protein
MATTSEKCDGPSKASISPELLGPMFKSIVLPKPLPDYDSTTTQSGSNQEQDDSATSGHGLTTKSGEQTTSSEAVERTPYVYFNGKPLYIKCNGKPKRTKEEYDEMVQAHKNLLSEREKVGAYKFDRYFLKHWKDYPDSDLGILGAVIKEYTADMDLDSETSESDDEDDMESEEENEEESEGVAEQGEVQDTTDYVQTTTSDV